MKEENIKIVKKEITVLEYECEKCGFKIQANSLKRLRFLVSQHYKFKHQNEH